MAGLELKSLRKSYGTVEVIKGVDLSIEHGEFVVFVGPSGCGKSTLLRMIAGLEDITGGELYIAGKLCNAVEPRDRGIAMVFQSYALYPHMTVYDNVGFGLKLAKTPKDVRDKKIRDAARILQMEHLLDRKPSQLSGGQRQRVAIGRAIVRQPEVFLFDEPLSNLDAKLRVQMRSEIKLNHQRLKTTTVYVTHDQIEAMTMADRIVVMNAGRIEQLGTPLELYDRPANRFVAGFIGSPAMSFVSGHYHSDGGQAAVTLEDGAVLPVQAMSLAHGSSVDVGIRPENYLFDAKGPLAMTVEVVEPTGPETHVFGRIAGQEVRCVFRIRLDPRPGDVLRLAAETNHIHLFDTVSGIRLQPA